MNAFEKSISLGLTGTDAEKAAVLATLGARDIPVSSISAWMRERGLWIQGITLRGSLHKLYQDTDNEEIKSGLDEWYASTISGQAEMVRLTSPEVAKKVSRIIDLISAMIPNGPAIVAEMYEMAGGRPWADCTAEQLAEQRSEAEIAATRRLLVDRWVDLHNTIMPSLESGSMTWDDAVALVVAAVEDE